MSESSERGKLGEEVVARDLRARGQRVFLAYLRMGSPDILWLLADDQPSIRVEARVTCFNAGGGGRVGVNRKRKPRDRCDIYAWIAPDMETVQYEANSARGRDAIRLIGLPEFVPSRSGAYAQRKYQPQNLSLLLEAA